MNDVDGPSESGSSADTPEEIRRQIAHEHHDMMAMVVKIESTNHPGTLRDTLRELHEHLSEHFEHEEGPNGLHQAVANSAAHQTANVQRLLNEHAELLDSLEEIETRLGELLDGPMASVVSDAIALTERLRAHEARESELFGDALYHDIGGGG